MLQEAKKLAQRNKRYLPLLFFVGGFIWDSLTLGRIDSLYSNVILCVYLLALSLLLYLYNLSEDGTWADTFLASYEQYFPLAIQFFLGGLCSAYVIFYSRSVSLTKTLVFFIILVILLLANELLKHRISNKYLQFGAYFFMNFTFFTFFLPMVVNAMNVTVFLVSGGLSLATTLTLTLFIYFKSPTTQRDMDGLKVTGLILGLYLLINGLYFMNLIPPLPLSLEEGIVASRVEKQENRYRVTYQPSRWHNFWRSYHPEIPWQQGDSVFFFTSIFAPADLEKPVLHRWQRYIPEQDSWRTTDRIGYTITGGRNAGYRGYTFKEQLTPGRWNVSVVTEEGMVLGSIDFTIYSDTTDRAGGLIRKTF